MCCFVYCCCKTRHLLTVVSAKALRVNELSVSAVLNMTCFNFVIFRLLMYEKAVRCEHTFHRHIMCSHTFNLTLYFCLLFLFATLTHQSNNHPFHSKNITNHKHQQLRIPTRTHRPSLPQHLPKSGHTHKPRSRIRRLLLLHHRFLQNQRGRSLLLFWDLARARLGRDRAIHRGEVRIGSGEDSHSHWFGV